MRQKVANTVRGGNIIPLVVAAAICLALFGGAMFFLAKQIDTSVAIKQKKDALPIPEVDPEAEPVVVAEAEGEAPTGDEPTEDDPSLIDAAVDVATDEEVQESVMGRINKWREDRKKEDKEDDQ